MTTATFLFTAFALICALIGVVCVKLCQDHVQSLRSTLGRIVQLEHELSALNASLHKVRQKIYYNARKSDEIEIAQPISAAECDNWLAAQTQGPSSSAAKCACNYCIAQRNERDALRAKLVPKTNSERRNAIEKGRS